MVFHPRGKRQVKKKRKWLVNNGGEHEGGDHRQT
jgi:hypothetical protein